MVTQGKAKKTLRREPLRAGTVGSGSLMLKSSFIGVCLLKPTFAFLGGQLPNLADFLQSLIWPSGARIRRPPRIGDFPGPVGKRTNIISSVVFIIKVLSKDKLIPLARIRLSIVIPTL